MADLSREALQCALESIDNLLIWPRPAEWERPYLQAGWRAGPRYPTPAHAGYVGTWFVQHFRSLARQYGTRVIAKRLRKQGIPLEIALLILTH